MFGNYKEWKEEYFGESNFPNIVLATTTYFTPYEIY